MAREERTDQTRVPRPLFEFASNLSHPTGAPPAGLQIEPARSSRARRYTAAAVGRPVRLVALV